MNTGEGLHRFVDPVDDEVYLYSQFEVADARRVFTVFDQPDLKATFTFTVTAPAALARGLQLAHARSPSRSSEPASAVVAVRAHPAVWRRTSPRSIAGPYHGDHRRADQRGRPHHPARRLLPRARWPSTSTPTTSCDITRAGFAFFERPFDRPYPFDKYDQLFVPEFNAGAMENAGAVTFLEAYVFRSKVPEAIVERRALTILHELAHMWFGDLVTMRWWDDLWLNESFAEYASTLRMAEATRWTSGVDDVLHRWRSPGPTGRTSCRPRTRSSPTSATWRTSRSTSTASPTPRAPACSSSSSRGSARTSSSQGVRRYFATHAWGNTELRRPAAPSSRRPAAATCAAWSRAVAAAGRRDTRCAREVEVDDDGAIDRRRRRAGGARRRTRVLRPHRLAVGGYDLSSGRLAAHRRGSSSTSTARAPRCPSSSAAGAGPAAGQRRRPGLRQDPARPASLATAMEHLGAFDDSLPRALVWGAAWDMTRDAEMAAARLRRAGAARTSRPRPTRRCSCVLLRQLATHRRGCTSPPSTGRRSPTGSADRLLELGPVAAEPGSDRQLQLVKAVRRPRQHARQQLAPSRGLLTGSEPLDGLRDRHRPALGAAHLAGRRRHAPARTRSTPSSRATTPPPGSGPPLRPCRHPDAGGQGSAPGVRRRRRRPAERLQAVGDRRVLARARPRAAAAVRESYFECARARLDHAHQRDRPADRARPLPDRAGRRSELLDQTDEWLRRSARTLPALRRLAAENRDGVRRALAAQERDSADRVG